MLSLEEAKGLQSHYYPRQEVAKTLHNKSLIMLVGPVATGKTRIINQVAALHPEFGPVSTFTTRGQRADDDPRLVHPIPHDDTHIAEILAKIEAGDVVQYAIHPTSGHFYWTEPSDYPYKYNLLATLSGVVASMAKLPFEKTSIVSLVCSPNTWEKWLSSRYPNASDERRKRVKEATQVLEWLLAQNPEDITWVENIANHPDQTAQQVVDSIMHNRGEELREVAYKMLDKAKELE